MSRRIRRSITRAHTALTEALAGPLSSRARAACIRALQAVARTRAARP